MMEIRIYREKGKLVARVVAISEGVERQEVMGSHTVSFSFESATCYTFLKGDWIRYGDEQFWLHQSPYPTVNADTGGFVYELVFYAQQERWRDFILQKDGLTSFPLVGSGVQHLSLVCDFLRERGLGSFRHQGMGDIREVRYEHVSVYEALNLIAQRYETEWWVADGMICLGKYESSEAVVALSYDQEIDSIDFAPSSAEYLTRLYAYGGRENMPNDTPLTLGGDTPYVDLIEGLPTEEVREGVQVFEQVYPRQRNVVSEVRRYEIAASDKVKRTVIYQVRDAKGVVLKRSDLLSTALKVHFTSGLLNGRVFEGIIKLVGGVTYYELKYVEEGDLYFPNEQLKPVVGDAFFLSGFDATAVLPSLVEDARKELRELAVGHLRSMGSAYVFSVSTRSIFCQKEGVNLSLGRRVALFSEHTGRIESRVRGFEKQLGNPYSATYSIGDSKRYSRMERLEADSRKREENLAQFDYVLDGRLNELLGRGDLRVELESDGGYFVVNNRYKGRITARLVLGTLDISDKAIGWAWSRVSGLEEFDNRSDALWNDNHKGVVSRWCDITEVDIVGFECKFVCAVTVANRTIKGMVSFGG